MKPSNCSLRLLWSFCDIVVVSLNFLLYVIHEPCCIKVQLDFEVVPFVCSMPHVSYYIYIYMYLISAMFCATMVDVQNKQMKEAHFIKKVQQNIKEEQANHMRW